MGVASLPKIHFAYEFDGDSNPLAAAPNADAILHYNLMRPLEALRVNGERPLSHLYSAWSYDRDAAWRKIAKLPGPKQAFVLVAARQTLLDRVNVRRDIEPDLVARDGDYDFQYWADVYNNANLPLVYNSFIQELGSIGVRPRFLVGRDNQFEEIDAAAVLGEIRSAKRTRYTADQIAELIKPSTFEYQRVALPHGIATHGHDRSATCDLVLPRNLNKATVLDIGCALGAVCFEAERRGALEVIGLEPRASRFEAGIVLKEILGSGVELRRETLAEFLVSERSRRAPAAQFDYVLLLNVLHHLDDPITTLRQCALVTKRQLIVEFPTLNDPIFAGVPSDLADRLNELPLMGVSTRAADQRFLFTPRALERVLFDHHSLFKSVRFLPSPMQGGRVIGIFEK